jgi:hypothetical protein
MTKEAFEQIADGLREAQIVAPYIAEIERLRKSMQDALTQARKPSYGYDDIKIDNYDDAIGIIKKALEEKQ